MICNRAHGLGADGTATKPEWIIRDSEDKSVWDDVEHHRSFWRLVDVAEYLFILSEDVSLWLVLKKEVNGQ